MNQKHYSDTILISLSLNSSYTIIGYRTVLSVFAAMMTIKKKYINEHKIKKCLKNQNKGVVPSWNYSLDLMQLKLVIWHLLN